MRIGELAELACVAPQTIRYYEAIGLLPQPPRTPSGYRDYDESAIGRLEVLRAARELGMSLQQIGQALPLEEDGRAPCDYVLGVLEEQARTVARRIRELELLQARLAHVISAAPRLPASAAGSCRLLEHACQRTAQDPDEA